MQLKNSCKKITVQYGQKKRAIREIIFVEEYRCENDEIFDSENRSELTYKLQKFWELNPNSKICFLHTVYIVYLTACD
jgi:hypothetical protein